MWMFYQQEFMQQGNKRLILFVYYFIRFPNSVKRPGVYSAWVEFVSKVRPGKFVPAKSSRICSVHFHADMFQS